MYSFDGQYKTGLTISLGGASRKVDKNELLKAAKVERLKREKVRREHAAALLIQSWYHGTLERYKLNTLHRGKFDSLTKSLEHLEQLLKLLCLFYNSNADFKRLISVCQLLLKANSLNQLEPLFDSPFNLDKLKNILRICCTCLNKEDANISIPLRMLEVFLSEKVYKSKTACTDVTLHLVQNGYFRDLSQLIDHRVPAALDEPSATPPTTFSAAACDLVLAPLNTPTDDTSKREILESFTEHILSQQMSIQTCYFLLPAVSDRLVMTSMQCFYDAVLRCQNTNSLWTLYSFLVITSQRKECFSCETDVYQYLNLLKELIKHLSRSKDERSLNYDSDDEMQTEPTQNAEDELHNFVFEQSIKIINEKSFTSIVSLNAMQWQGCCTQVCAILHHLTTVHPQHLTCTHALAFQPNFLHACWNCLSTRLPQSLTSKSSQEETLGLLTVFCMLFKYTLFSVYDDDFYSTQAGCESSLMPFTLQEVVEMSRLIIKSIVVLITNIYSDSKQRDVELVSKCEQCCQSATSLIKQLYLRDCRRSFCPSNHWLSTGVFFNESQVNIAGFAPSEENEQINRASMNQARPGTPLDHLRNMAVLKYIPFIIPFLQRIKILHRIIEEDKKKIQTLQETVMPYHGINITVNRKYLYQDAYDQLSADRASDIRRVIRIQMINAQGLDEAGIDGGGVFREFMSQLIRAGFDPSIGFFRTNPQHLLYPNPAARLVHPDYLKHLHFLGRMLGKAIYEHMIIELPLTDFFLCKLLNKRGSADVDIHHLESLDPQLYKNLLYLKNDEGDADELALNFTIVNSDYGETKVVELKANGVGIAVTNENKIEYIHLMADYMLNKQIRLHCNAFRSGLADVIDIEWLQLFDHRELQLMISGSQVAIDMADLRANTNYSGSYAPEDPYIEQLWNVLESLTDHKRRLFLKFVTSCSRPPLLGFSELYPKFCIHDGGTEDRLPTASTCMNFLKLPRYENGQLLKERLVYAIESGAGFELS